MINVHLTSEAILIGGTYSSRTFGFTFYCQFFKIITLLFGYRFEYGTVGLYFFRSYYITQCF